MEGKHIPLIILNIIIIIISLYLLFLIFKSKSFHKYPCYNMIIFSFIIFIDNILRIIPTNENKKHCNIVDDIFAYFIVFFDKLILATLSMQSLIYYLGVLKTDFYSANEAKIFYITLCCSLVISGTISAYYILKFGTKDTGNYYCYSKDPLTKKIIDDIFNSIYLLISIYCSIVPLKYISLKKKEVESGLIDDLNYSHHFNRILITLLLNILTFGLSFLIIHDAFPSGDYVDLIYLITCLVVDLFNCLNEEVYKETLKIFCKKKYNKRYNLIKTQKTNFDDDDDD